MSSEAGAETPHDTSPDLRVPELDPDIDILGAAFAYAKAGWFVMPLRADSKRPILSGWTEHSSTDPHEIAAWFSGTDCALGLHVGRSGSIVFDVDDPALVPEMLARHLGGVEPHQSTRSGAPGRGHYVFAQPPGRMLGNSRGALSAAPWGEVRGANGQIAVMPSRHAKADQGGRYSWIRTGPVPPLPAEIADVLPDFTGSNGAASSAAVRAFLGAHVGNDRPGNLTAISRTFEIEAARGSRHEALVAALAWAMREAAMGFFPAKSAAEALRAPWSAMMSKEPGRFAGSEFEGVLSWAVSAALADSEHVQARRKHVIARLDKPRNGSTAKATPSPTTRIEPIIDSDKAMPGESDEPATPMPAGEILPPLRDPADYFSRDGIDVALLASDALSMGGVSFGVDGSFWSYVDGVWRRTPQVVEARIVSLLGGRFRRKHTGDTAPVVEHSVAKLRCEPTPDYMNFENGMLDWRTGALLPHDPDFGSTVQFPHSFDPDATCPRFEAFLESILEPDYVHLVWEMIGYLMMSGNPLQKAFMLLGTGANGKGTLIRVIEALLGRANIATQSLDALSNNRFAPVSLHAKIANLAGDIDKTYQESTAQFKMLTGEDTFSAEYKYGAAFSFQNWAVPVFSANTVPGSSDTSEGYLRRWIIIEFDKTIPPERRVPGYSDAMLGEVPGIAAKGIATLRSMMVRNGGKGGFYASDVIAGGADRFAEHIDQARQWINSGSVLVDPSSEESQSDVFAAYKRWAKENHVGVFKSSELMHRLAAIPGVSVGKTSGRRWVRGFKVYMDNRAAAAASGLIDTHDDTDPAVGPEW